MQDSDVFFLTNGNKTLSGVDEMNCPAELHIPSGVTKIDNHALADCPANKVFIPDSVTEIGYEAFSGCDALEYVRMPKHLETAGPAIFRGCLSLTKVEMGDTISNFSESMFEMCPSLVEAPFRSGITEVPRNLFSECVSIESLVIPEGVAVIRSGAAAYCENLSTVVLPSTIRIIEDDAFRNCPSLAHIRINGESPVFFIDEDSGCLFERREDGDLTIIKVPVNATEIRIPKTVTHSHSEAFQGCDVLERVFIDCPVVDHPLFVALKTEIVGADIIDETDLEAVAASKVREKGEAEVEGTAEEEIEDTEAEEESTVEEPVVQENEEPAVQENEEPIQEESSVEDAVSSSSEQSSETGEPTVEIKKPKAKAAPKKEKKPATPRKPRAPKSTLKFEIQEADLPEPDEPDTDGLTVDASVVAKPSKKKAPRTEAVSSSSEQETATEEEPVVSEPTIQEEAIIEEPIISEPANEPEVSIEEPAVEEPEANEEEISVPVTDEPLVEEEPAIEDEPTISIEDTIPEEEDNVGISEPGFNESIFDDAEAEQETIADDFQIEDEPAIEEPIVEEHDEPVVEETAIDESEISESEINEQIEDEETVAVSSSSDASVANGEQDNNFHLRNRSEATEQGSEAETEADEPTISVEEPTVEQEDEPTVGFSEIVFEDAVAEEEEPEQEAEEEEYTLTEDDMIADILGQNIVATETPEDELENILITPEEFDEAVARGIQDEEKEYKIPEGIFPPKPGEEPEEELPPQEPRFVNGMMSVSATSEIIDERALYPDRPEEELNTAEPVEIEDITTLVVVTESVSANNGISANLKNFCIDLARKYGLIRIYFFGALSLDNDEFLYGFGKFALYRNVVYAANAADFDSLSAEIKSFAEIAEINSPVTPFQNVANENALELEKPFKIFVQDNFEGADEAASESATSDGPHGLYEKAQLAQEKPLSGRGLLQKAKSALNML